MAPRVEQIEQALMHLGLARNLLKGAKAPQALAKARSAMKSAEGARRHAMGRDARCERRNA